jgi:release factor glutamine methyltransferase
MQEAAAKALAAAGIENPRLEARLLMAAACGLTAEALLTSRDEPAPAGFAPLLARRLAREPLAYILGFQEFWSLRFAVSPATLIPRADSETIVEAALAATDRTRGGLVLDLGTGTGCLLLSVLHEWPAAWGLGIDRDPAAAALAAANARALGLAGRSAFLSADWATPVAERFNLVLCNPPYIPETEIGSLMPEVRLYEPHSALAGGLDGLDEYRRLIAALPDLLVPDGLAVFEVGAGQAEAVMQIGRARGFQVAAKPDLAGISRAILLFREGEVEKSIGNPHLRS